MKSEIIGFISIKLFINNKFSKYELNDYEINNRSFYRYITNVKNCFMEFFNLCVYYSKSEKCYYIEK